MNPHPQRELIDTSFRKLRSAEGAFELLSNFKSIESRGAIQQQMMNKLVDILEQFHREIGAAQVGGQLGPLRWRFPEGGPFWGVHSMLRLDAHAHGGRASRRKHVRQRARSGGPLRR